MHWSGYILTDFLSLVSESEVETGLVKGQDSSFSNSYIPGHNTKMGQKSTQTDRVGRAHGSPMMGPLTECQVIVKARGNCGW